ncbi:MAG: alanine racemase [Bacilli bacterium]|nr:alanine racemase [Bacilli bacterium]
MYRNTFVEVNLKNLKYNIESLINKYNGYEYFFGVVKADCYGHNDISTVKAIIEAGCNYLAVATLDEALAIRKEIKDVPILCLSIVDIKYLPLCLKNEITITVSNLDYIKNITTENPNLKVHIKVNTGMNRLGVSNKNEFNTICKLIKEKHFVLEGIYTHIYNPINKIDTFNQFEEFERITGDINLKEIPIVHVGASETTEFYSKRSYANGCRLGISMYGLIDCDNVNFKSTFSLYSEIVQINEVEHGVVGYSGSYKVNGKEKIAVIPIGYADGIIRKNTGRNIYINNKPYEIVGNICMDMLFVKVDDSVKVGDKVTIIKDIDHIKEIAKHLDTITYEVICSISKRVPRIYIK